MREGDNCKEQIRGGYTRMENLSPIYDYIIAFKAEPQDDLEAYYTRLDAMELKFRQCITECILNDNAGAVSMCEDDLEEVVETYRMRWRPKSAVEEKLKCQMDYALGKAKDALKYIKKMKAKHLGAVSVTETSPQRVDMVATRDADVISGTDGLAEFLGCSHNKAFDIIKSRVLPRDVQYQTGRVWKFNRVRLERFLSEHPEALGRVRQGGILD